MPTAMQHRTPALRSPSLLDDVRSSANRDTTVGLREASKKRRAGWLPGDPAPGSVWRGAKMPCADCGISTGKNGEYYMLEDPVWKAAMKDKPARFLCIGCVEKRLGRKLTPNDFAAYPINLPTLGNKSARLLDRLGE